MTTTIEVPDVMFLQKLLEKLNSFLFQSGNFVLSFAIDLILYAIRGAWNWLWYFFDNHLIEIELFVLSVFSFVESFFKLSIALFWSVHKTNNIPKIIEGSSSGQGKWFKLVMCTLGLAFSCKSFNVILIMCF